MKKAEGGPNHLVPVAFFHHTLTKAEKGTIQQTRNCWLYTSQYSGSETIRLITDHMAVKYLCTLNANDEKGRRGRWVKFFQQFDMELVHRGV